MAKMIAYCGLVCSNCPTFIATQTDDDEARERTAALYAEKFGLKLKKEEINCDGCLSAGGRLIGYCQVCEIRRCARAQGVKHCAWCPEEPCEKLSRFHEFSPEAKAAFESLKAKGKMNLSIRLEEAKDHRKVEFLTREAFWNLYQPGCVEHLLVHKIRKVPAFVKELAFVASDGGEIVGNIIYSKARIINDNRKEFEVLCLGPIGVLPAYQGQGIGSWLMNFSIEKARQLGYKAIILFGKPDYYQRFGFVNAQKYGIKTPSGENFDEFMVLELFDGALKGISGKFEADEVFNIAKPELEIFEKDFPFKEKQVTDTQLK